MENSTNLQPTCDCDDSPLSIVALCIGIATFFFAVVGFLAGGIALSRAWQNSNEEIRKQVVALNVSLAEFAVLGFGPQVTLPQESQGIVDRALSLQREMQQNRGYSIGALRKRDRFLWLGENRDLVHKMRERNALTPSLLAVKVAMISNKLDTLIARQNDSSRRKNSSD